MCGPDLCLGCIEGLGFRVWGFRFGLFRVFGVGCLGFRVFRVKNTRCSLEVSLLGLMKTLHPEPETLNPSHKV